MMRARKTTVFFLFYSCVLSLPAVVKMGLPHPIIVPYLLKEVHIATDHIIGLRIRDLIQQTLLGSQHL